MQNGTAPTMSVTIDPAKVLSAQQYNIVQLLAAGKSIPQAAAILGVQPCTITSTHMRQIRKRLGIVSCADLRARIQVAA